MNEKAYWEDNQKRCGMTVESIQPPSILPYALAKTKDEVKDVCEIIVNANLKCIKCKVRSYLSVLARQLGGWPVLYTVHS